MSHAADSIEKHCDLGLARIRPRRVGSFSEKVVEFLISLGWLEVIGGVTKVGVPDAEIRSDQAVVMRLHEKCKLVPYGELAKIDALLADKRQLIFQGPPGTGKTFLAQKLSESLSGTKGRVSLVQFHPSYAYEDFVQGFRPSIVQGQPAFELREGPFLVAARHAREAPEANHFLIIDEINRGNLAKVLGELYFLLEYRDKEILLQYSDEAFSLPENLYIIGTMNTADRSIALVDLALRRRFHFVEFHPDKPPIKGLLESWLKKNAPNMMPVADLVDRANKKLDDRHAAIGELFHEGRTRRQEGRDDLGAQRASLHRRATLRRERTTSGFRS